MAVVTITYAAHKALLNVEYGEGVLVRPRAEHDVQASAVESVYVDGQGREQPCILSASLHEADWDYAVRDLYRQGWEPAEDDEEELVVVTEAEDGREIIRLCAQERIITDPTPDELVDLWGELLLAAGARRTR